MERTDLSPEDFLASLADDHRDDMAELDRVISENMAGRCRVMWEGVFWGGTQQSIIGYGDMIQPRPKGATVEWFVVGLARQKRGISIYVNAVEDGQYLGALYAKRLGKVKVGAASLSFPRSSVIDLEVLGELVAHASRLSPPTDREER